MTDVLKEDARGFDKPITYAVKHKLMNERLASQSGGMFAVVSDVVLSQGGVIYGCVFDEKFSAMHVRAETKEARDKMRYSKYVQSNLGKVFSEVLVDLKQGRTVLFSGTSCQIAGLKSFIEAQQAKNENGKLLTVDIVCHGVPSPRVWKDYLNWESNRKHSAIKHVICRNKVKYGWKSHVTSIYFKNGKKVHSRVFPKLFYGHQILRPSCYQCPYKNIIHPSDITIADYWGIDKVLPGFKDDKGVSLVLINNQVGQELFDCCVPYIDFKETKIEDSLQPPLIAPYDPPTNRGQFWSDYRKYPFVEIAKKYGNWGVLKDLNWKIKVYIKRKLKGFKKEKQ